MYVVKGERKTEQNPIHNSNPQVYACTVGQKPSKAKFYVNEPTDVLNALEKLSRV